jgi:cell division protein FtsL
MDESTGANPDAPSSRFSWLPEQPVDSAETPIEEIPPLDVRVTDAPAPVAGPPPVAAPPPIAVETPIALRAPLESAAVFAPGNAPVAPPAAGGPYAPLYPMSGPPAVGYPVSGPPISGVPFGYPTTAYPPVAPPKSRRAAVIILTILTALLTMATGVMTTLYLLKANEAKQLNQKITAHESTISSQRHDLEGLNRQVDDVKRQLTSAQDESTQLHTANDAIAKCLNTIYDFWDLLDQNKTTEARTKADEVDQLCSEADKYL